MKIEEKRKVLSKVLYDGVERYMTEMEIQGLYDILTTDLDWYAECNIPENLSCKFHSISKGKY